MKNNISKQNLEKLVGQLSNLGEDKDELNLWLTIFEDLEPEEQGELTTILQDELKKLTNFNKLKK